jgi:DNA-binding MarR family transcriptional regulator
VNYVVFEFINVSGSLVTRICEHDYGVTREQWQVVAMLASLGPLSPSALADATTLDRSQLSRTLRAMQAKDLILRQRVEGDGRRAVVTLSDGGRALFDKLFPRVVRLHQQVLAGVAPDERRALARALQRMQRNAHDAFTTLAPEAGGGRGRKVKPARA